MGTLTTTQKSNKKEILLILEYGRDMFIVNNGGALAAAYMSEEIEKFKKEFADDLQLVR